jgi:phosphate transport system substrate-binding protein
MGIKKTLVVAALSTVVMATAAQARDQIRIVGSSTVYPFSTAVAETFGKSTSFKTPVIESTGTGGGFKLFCSGVGEEFPDFSNASRAIKKSEQELCESNGVKNITEVKVGYDGIVLANSKKSPQMKITRKQIFLALAKDVPNAEGKLVANPNKTWHDVDPTLPNVKIEVLGPPPTYGTRDAFDELALQDGCDTFPELKALKKTDKKMHKAVCQSLREDGAYIEAGENDNLIIQKLNSNPDAFGVFGFSFLDQNADVVQGSNIDDKDVSFESIADSSYPLSRPLFFYVKNAHIGQVPGMLEYLAEFTAEKAWGMDGYLADKGLIPMPTEERAKYKASVEALGKAGS